MQPRRIIRISIFQSDSLRTISLLSQLAISLYELHAEFHSIEIDNYKQYL